MKIIQLSVLLFACTICVFGQKQRLTLQRQVFELHNVTGSIIKFEGKDVLKIERDLKALPFDENNIEATVDENHYARLVGLEDFENGTIEVKMYSQIQDPPPYPGVAGFIGIYFRIKEDDSAFEGIYVRPKVGRASNQMLRNHAVQYISYPHAKFDVDALEDTVVLRINYDDLIDLYIKAPKFDRIFRVLLENHFMQQQERIGQLFSSTAEERYQSFLETYPHLQNRLSQVQIASYLGVTPEFLSRIRNRMAKGEK